MPKGRQPRGATPRPRSEAAAESARLRQLGNYREELPRIRGQGGQRRGDTQSLRSGSAARRRYPTPPHLRPGAAAGRSYPTPPHLRPGAVVRRTNHMPEARGSDQEDKPHVQGAVAAWAQEGLEELSHVEGQEGWQ